MYRFRAGRDFLCTRRLPPVGGLTARGHRRIVACEDVALARPQCLEWARRPRGRVVRASSVWRGDGRCWLDTRSTGGSGRRTIRCRRVFGRIRAGARGIRFAPRKRWPTSCWPTRKRGSGGCFATPYLALLESRFEDDRAPFDELARLAKEGDVFLGCSCPTKKNPRVDYCHTYLALKFMKRKYRSLCVQLPEPGGA